MRVPTALVQAFKEDFEPILTEFLMQEKLLPEGETLQSKRFMARSIAPHVKTLSSLFNRTEGTQTDGIDEETYWTGGGSPKNRRLAYFLSFMPCNLFRTASVWAELKRLGFQWPFSQEQDFRGIEWGAGVASGACGIIAGERFAPVGLPKRGNFALIEQSKAALELGTKWLDFYSDEGFSVRSFHRRVDLKSPWLPAGAPKFHLFVFSYFLNESEIAPEVLVEQFLKTCEQHLEEEGLVLIIEPALRLQSRKLLDFRRTLLEHPAMKSGKTGLKVLLPCLGHQACGALAKPDDWCHEEVSWWRPPYLRELDAVTGLDRKSLPFSYLVIQKTRRSVEELLPALRGSTLKRHRLVSPSHSLSKKTIEFFICGHEGKRRARLNLQDLASGGTPDRGSILQEVELHGDPALSQIERAEILGESTD
jgi:hypothetical protein